MKEIREKPHGVDRNRCQQELLKLIDGFEQELEECRQYHEKKSKTFCKPSFDMEGYKKKVNTLKSIREMFQ